MKDKFYYKDGTTSEDRDYSKALHRTDGPAVESASGSKRWYVDDRLHRVDGTAIVWAGGGKSWWVDGKPLSEEEFKALIEEVESLPKALRLIDPREWVRKVV